MKPEKTYFVTFCKLVGEEEIFGTVETEIEYCGEKMVCSWLCDYNNDECFEGYEFYQWGIIDDELCQMFFDYDVYDDNGEPVLLDSLDYEHPYRIDVFPNQCRFIETVDEEENENTNT